MMAARMIVFGDEIVTEPVSPEVAQAIHDFHVAHLDEFTKVLAPYGLEPMDILEPTYERVIHEDEAPIFAKLAKDFRVGS